MAEQNETVAAIGEDQNLAFFARRAEKRRDRAIRNRHESEMPLNIVSMIDMMTTVMFFLLTQAVIVQVGVIDVSSPRAPSSGKSAQAEQQETPVPKVTVYISKDGFRLLDQSNLPAFAPFAVPIERCGGAAAQGAVRPTICLREGAGATEPLVRRLDYAALYNQLVKIRLEPTWFEGFAKDDNSVISISADQEVPFDAIIKTMDTARYFLKPAGKDPAAPSATADLSSFLLGASGNPTIEDLETSKYLVPAGKSASDRHDLFPFPVLLAPRPAGG